MNNKIAILALAASTCLGACSSTGGEPPAEDKNFGSLQMRLTSSGEGDAHYRLRDAEFSVQHRFSTAPCDVSAYEPQEEDYEVSWVGDDYWYPEECLQPVVTVSSETNPNAEMIQLRVESGEYLVTLQSGWRLEKVNAEGEAKDVDALLLDTAEQWAWVESGYPSEVKFSFGVGGEKIDFFGGDLGIGIEVYTPEEYQQRYDYDYDAGAPEGEY